MTLDGLLVEQDQLRPIETRYNSVLFRSRKEARFAVFLDTLGIPHEWEQEGYYLSDGEKYLPDFWLPATKTFVEIKGKEPTLIEFSKAQRLALLSNCTTVLIWGDFTYPAFIDNSYTFFKDDNGVFYSERGTGLFHLGPQCAIGLFTALNTARSARFEFGRDGQ